MTSPCAFPDCKTPAAVVNRAGQWTCRSHWLVVVAMTDDLGHGRHSESADDQ